MDEQLSKLLSKLLSCLQEEANITANLEARRTNTAPVKRYMMIVFSGGFAAAQANYARMVLLRTRSWTLTSYARFTQGSERIYCGSR